MPLFKDEVDGLTLASALGGTERWWGTQSGDSVAITPALVATYVLAADAEIAALAGLTSAADRLPYFTGSGTAALATFTSFGRSLVDDADASAARTTLGLVLGTNVQAFDATLLSIAALGTAADRFAYTTGVDTWAETALTSFGRSLIDDANAAAALTTLGVSAFAQTLLDDAAASNARTTLGLGTSAVIDTGTSGTTIPLLDGANTWSAAQTFANVVLGSANTLAWSTDLFLQRDAANALALRNSTTLQAFRVYRTFTDASNYERLGLTSDGSNFIIHTESAGTGSPRGLQFSIGAGNPVWTITTGSNFVAVQDNIVDFGSTSQRARNVYAGTAFIVTDGVTAPTATVGHAKIFVDTADGDLKVIFGDGTTKVIVADT